jgi:hypothetical protein
MRHLRSGKPHEVVARQRPARELREAAAGGERTEIHAEEAQLVDQRS